MNSFHPVFINRLITSDTRVQLNLESDRDHLTAARAAACFGNIWKTQEKMFRLIVITTVLSVFILLLYIPYVPSKDLNYNQGVETRRIIEQPPSENNPALYALESLHFLI